MPKGACCIPCVLICNGEQDDIKSILSLWNGKFLLLQNMRLHFLLGEEDGARSNYA